MRDFILLKIIISYKIFENYFATIAEKEGTGGISYAAGTGTAPRLL